METMQKRILTLKAEVLQAIAQPIRLAVIELLADGEMCVCDIATSVGAERSNVSRHLGIMLKAGVLDVRKDGLKMIYRIKTPCLLKFLSCVNNVVREKIKSEAAVLENL